MTAERIKITYATLRADNEELHAAVRGGRSSKAKARLGAHHQNFIDGAERDGDGDVRGPLADRPRHPRRDVRDGHRARTSQDAIAAARARPAGVGRARAGESASRSSAAPAELISERQMEYGGLHGDRGRQEPARGARRGRGGGRPHPLLREDGRGQRRATTTRWTTSATRPSTPGRSSGRTACSRSSARSTSRWRWPSGPIGGGADGRQHGRLQAVERVAAVGDQRSSRPIATPASPTACSTSSWARATPSARSSRTNPGIDGIVFTGSYEVGLRAVPQRSRPRYPRPAIVEMGGKNPAIVSRKRRPRGGGRGDHARGVRLRRPEVLGQLRVYVERPVHDELVRLLVEKTEKITIGDPLVRGQLAGPGHRRARRRSAPGGGRRGAPRRHGLHRRRAPDRRRPRARLLRRADGRRRPAGVAPAVPRRAVRAVHRGRRRRLARRGAARSPTTTSTG